MKKALFTLLLMGVLCSAFAQNVNNFNYQAIVRDSSGDVLQNQNISLKISLLEGNPQGEAKYVENHDTLTSAFGMVSITVGNGEIISGNIGSLLWGDSIYFLKTELDLSGSGTYELMGISQIMAVPVSLYSKMTGDTSRWIRSNDHIYYNRGNIGIGTSSPAAMLHLYRNASLPEEKPGLNFTNSAPDGNTWFFGLDPLYSPSGFTIRNDSLPNVPSLMISKEGNIGIRKSDPVHTIDIEGSIYASQGIHFADSTFINSATSFWTGYDNCVFQENGSVVIGNSSCSQYRLAISPDTSGKALSIDNITELDEFGALNVKYPGGSVNQVGYFNAENNQKYGYGIQMLHYQENDTIDKWTGLYIDYENPDSSKYAAIFKSGNVGIGTDSPKHNLHIEGSSMVNGNLGIKKLYPEYTLDLAGNFRMHDTLVGDSASFSNRLLFRGSEHENSSKIEVGKGVSDESSVIKLVTKENGKIQFFTDSKIRMQIRDTMVVIGRPVADKYVDLSVNGKIRTQEVEVYIGTWWDCVFDNDYNLPSLSEVESFIDKNNHLPGIPSQQEVMEEGVNLGEMDGLLLKKIEELTLYVIELHKQNDYLAGEIEKLKKQ